MALVMGVQGGEREGLTGIPVLWSLVGQLMEHRAQMGLGFYLRQERLPHMTLFEEKLGEIERKSPQQTKRMFPQEMRWFSLT